MERQSELLQQAKDAGIQISYKDKYEKGKKAQGPRNLVKFNISVLELAISENAKQVTIWRG